MNQSRKLLVITRNKTRTVYTRTQFSTRKIKNRKAAGVDEIPPDVWKTKEFDDILFRHCNALNNKKKKKIDRLTKGFSLPYPKKRDLKIAKNYRGITLISIVAKIYNALLRNCLEPKIDKRLS